MTDYLSQHDDNYRKADASGEGKKAVNLIPDGQYNVNIDNVRLQELTKTPGVMLVFEMSVFNGPHAGEPCEHVIVFSPKNEWAAQNLKYIATACGLEILPSQLSNAAVRAAFIGYVLNGKLETKGEYKNWKYWSLVTAPERSDGSEFDTAPDEYDTEGDEPPEELNTEKKREVANDVSGEVGPLDDDIDIGEDPF